MEILQGFGPSGLELETPIGTVSAYAQENGSGGTNCRGRGTTEVVDNKGSLDSHKRSGARRESFISPGGEQVAGLGKDLLLRQLCRYEAKKLWIEIRQQRWVVQPTQFNDGAYRAAQYSIQEKETDN
jgi:hypothetical protein